MVYGLQHCYQPLMLAISFGLFAALCWSVHDLVARRFAEVIGPYRMALATLLVGALLLSGWVAWRGTLGHADAALLWRVVILGLAYGAAVSSLFKAFSMAPVSVVGPFTAGYPALVVLWGVYTGSYPGFLQYVAILVILLGAVVVGRFGPADGGLGSVAKNRIVPLFFFCTVAVVCFAAAVILGQAVSLKLGEIETTFLSRLPAAMLLLPLAMTEKTAASRFSRASWTGIFAMALLDVSAVAAINYMGRLPGKELGAMGISAYGAVSVLLAMIILKEKVAAGQWAGIAMIVAGVGTLSVPA